MKYIDRIPTCENEWLEYFIKNKGSLIFDNLKVNNVTPGDFLIIKSYIDIYWISQVIDSKVNTTITSMNGVSCKPIIQIREDIIFKDDCNLLVWNFREDYGLSKALILKFRSGNITKKKSRLSFI